MKIVIIELVWILVTPKELNITEKSKKQCSKQ